MHLTGFFAAHGPQQLYQTAWSPQQAHLFGAVGAGRSLDIYDGRFSGEPVFRHEAAHAREILCIDWNKYADAVIATGSVDLAIHIWDIRMNGHGPISKSGDPCISNRLLGHRRAVRDLRWSPYSQQRLVSVGYVREMVLVLLLS